VAFQSYGSIYPTNFGFGASNQRLTWGHTLYLILSLEHSSAQSAA